MVTVKLENFADLTGLYQRQLEFVVKQTTNDAIALGSRTATGVSRGGTVQRGFVPRADGTLAASLVSTLSGSTVLTQGEGDYNLVIGNMTTGDVATFSWTAPHARVKNYGDENNQGWFWIQEVEVNWVPLAKKNIALAKASQR